MDAFVKKLVDKATKKPRGTSEGLKPEDVSPAVSFHYGIPLRSCMFSYEPTQKIIAISTKNGQIKLLGKDNSQALLESKEMLPSKFVEFVHNRGFLLNVTTTNHIEVWDIDRKLLTYVHEFHEEITSFMILQHSPYIYVGDCNGNVTVLKLNQESQDIEKMKYTIPLSDSRGNTNEVASDAAVMHILPQPTAESKRILLVFADGFIALWDIRQSKTIFSRSLIHSLGHETKKVTSASWACPFGSKIVIGYMNGEILLHNIPSPAPDPAELTIDRDSSTMQNATFSKLNLVYKSEKIPIESLKWVYGDGKATRLYVLGYSASMSSNLVQVILLNEHTESRMIKLGVQLPEPCLAMEIVSGFSSEQQGKRTKQGMVLLLGESGHIYAYDDHSIEKYLLQSQSKSPPSNPSEIKIKLPFTDHPSITCAKFISNNSCLLNFSDEGHLLVTKNVQVLSLETKQFEANNFNGFSKVKNLYVTGHSDGMIKFWDASYPIFLPLLSLKEQSECDSSSSGSAVTAILYDSESQLLVGGDQSGMVCIYRFKPEPYSKENSFISLSGPSKKGCQHHLIHSVKQIKVNGSVLSLTINCSAKQLTIGTEQGCISLVDTDEATLLYQKDIASELSTGIISLQFGTCNLLGFEKNILVVTTRDSSVLALESNTLNTMGPSKVQPKKPSRALFLQILDGQEGVCKGSLYPPDQSENDATPKQLLLLCSEKAAYVYSLKHVTQGVKKVYYKAKFHDSSCCWASTFFSSSSMGLLLLFPCGKIEIRSLPDLSLVKETKLRSFMYSPPKTSSYPDGSICSSPDGELIVARNDQEITSVSIQPRKETYRDLDSFSRVYDKNLVSLCDEFASATISQKDKQKGIFGFFMKDLKGNRTRNGADGGCEDVRASFEELSTVFSSSNFAPSTETTDNNIGSEEDAELDIDDIEIEDVEEKRKGFNMPTLNKQKLTSRLHSLKGKVKQMKGKHEKGPPQEEPKHGKAGIVDQVKKKYGVPSSSGTSFAKLTQGKLAENLNKLQGVAQRTTEMQDNARSFASNANDLLHAVERNRLR